MDLEISVIYNTVTKTELFIEISALCDTEVSNNIGQETVVKALERYLQKFLNIYSNSK